MKQFLRAVSIAVCLFSFQQGFAQCPAGYYSASVNWDNLSFLRQDPTYIDANKAQNQYFALGTNKLTVVHNFNTSNEYGENATHTGEAGSYGTGEDVQFSGNGTVTLSFATAVQNVRFSIYDIDYAQRFAITALNGATAQNVVAARAGGTQLTVAGSGTTSATATGGATTAVAVDANDGTLNVDVAGPVTSITLTITLTGTKTNGQPASQEDGSFWISDIAACINNVAFPSNYYAVSQPYSGQPGYVLTAIDNSVLIVNPANGQARTLFTDPTGNNINSMGYDPYNKVLYYTHSLTGASGTPNANDKTIWKYDVTSGAITTWVSNVTTLGVPTYGSGVESGGAAFYDGAFYLGIEGQDGDESIVWRIDIDASGNAVIPARQVFALATDSHDWGDFALVNGTLYDFDGKTSSNHNIYEYNLTSGNIATTFNSGTLSFIPRQISIDWNGAIYNMGTAATSSSGTIVPYNSGLGTINTAQQYTITVGTTTPSGSWGDAAEAFKPRVDFGDAPASYDAVGSVMAIHERDTALRIGSSMDIEWNKKGITTSEDTDDGLPFVALYSNMGNYQTDVNVYNNTGTNATLCAWVDFNNNGVFDAGEGITRTISSMATAQTINLLWTGVVEVLANNSYIQLRVRITSAANAMTTSNPTGFFLNGEVEDYLVLVTWQTLAVKLNDFAAKKLNDDQAMLEWNVTDEETSTKYELQRSADGRNWTNIHLKNASGAASKAYYQFVDAKPETPVSYYRLKYYEPGTRIYYSDVQKLNFALLQSVTVYPNPAAEQAFLKFSSIKEQVVQLQVSDAMGKTVFVQAVAVAKGVNTMELPFVKKLAPGNYRIQLITPNETTVQQIIITR